VLKPLFASSSDRRTFWIDSLSGIDLLDNRLHHRQHILQDETFAFFVVEFHPVVIFKLVSGLNDTRRFSRIIQTP
jgi:hypothetical protein